MDRSGFLKIGFKMVYIFWFRVISLSFPSLPLKMNYKILKDKKAHTGLMRISGHLGDIISVGPQGARNS